MEQRFKDDSVKKPVKHVIRPVVTISRDAGCSGNVIADLLAEKLNAFYEDSGKKKDWKVINKEVIEMAARELELHPSKIKPIFKGEKKTLLDEMIFSMSTKYYKSDRKIKRTITDVIKSFAQEGNVIIVGRAGVAISQDHPASLHLKLYAPLEWRIEVIAKKHKISSSEARKYIQEVDKGRDNLLKDFTCDTSDCIFDMMYNCKKISKEAIVENVFNVMELRKLI
jgi:cytidylate kinase